MKDKANLLLGTARAALCVLPVAAPIGFNLKGGASYIRQGGAGYQSGADRDDVGGATVGLHLRRVRNFYVAADDHVYGTRSDARHPLERRSPRTMSRLRSASGSS